MSYCLVGYTTFSSSKCNTNSGTRSVSHRVVEEFWLSPPYKSTSAQWHLFAPEQELLVQALDFFGLCCSKNCKFLLLEPFWWRISDCFGWMWCSFSLWTHVILRQNREVIESYTGLDAAKHLQTQDTIAIRCEGLTVECTVCFSPDITGAVPATNTQLWLICSLHFRSPESPPSVFHIFDTQEVLLDDMFWKFGYSDLLVPFSGWQVSARFSLESCKNYLSTWCDLAACVGGEGLVIPCVIMKIYLKNFLETARNCLSMQLLIAVSIFLSLKLRAHPIEPDFQLYFIKCYSCLKAESQLTLH